MKHFPEEQAWATGIRGPLKLADILYVARKANRIAPLQVVRADRVVGEAHVRSAARHAMRARHEGRAAAQKPEVEFTRYLAGEKQILAAIEKMGVQDGCPAAVVVGLGAKGGDAIQYFLDQLGLEVAELPAADEDSLRRFGITEQALGATTADRRLDLVLEAVARVDAM